MTPALVDGLFLYAAHACGVATPMFIFSRWLCLHVSDEEMWACRELMSVYYICIQITVYCR